MLTGCAPSAVKKSTSELPKVRMRRPRKSFRLVKAARQNTTCAGKGYMATSRAPKRSKSRFATGKTASAMRRASLMSGARPARSIPSRMGTSPESVVSVPAPISTWPERTRRTISLPARLRSACVESCTCTRPLLRAAVPSRSTGISTRVYCGWVGSGCVTAEMRIGAPAGSVGNCAAAEKTMPVAITTPARSCFNIMKTSKVRLFVSVHHVHAMTSTALHHFAGCTAIQCRAISTRRVIQTSRLSAM